MHQKDFQTAKNFHFIGIGGSGMSGLARILQQRRKTVAGSDEKESSTTLALGSEGIPVAIGHDAKNIDPYAEVVVYSSAIPEGNPEMEEAQKRNLLRLPYPQAVGYLTQERKTVCICGTHGKTTTTALIAASLIATGEDPTVIVGSPTKELAGRNERIGNGKYFVLESCEYRRAFLNFHPSIMVITNIEVDHLDYYKDLEDYKNAYREFIAKLPKDGLLVANYDDENVRDVLKDFTTVPIKWFGKSPEADFQLKENSIYKKDRKILDFSLQIPGEHNLMNALATVTLASLLKLDLFDVRQAIESYTGAARRFETIGQVGKTIIIDDYGHHPTEIVATLRAAREKFGSDKKILCIFQPHQYSRTYKLIDGFAKAFQDADEVVIPNIFEVRDTVQDIKNINEEKLVQKIGKYHKHVSFGQGMEKTTEKIRKDIGKFDVVITMGAGDVWKIGKNLLQ